MAAERKMKIVSETSEEGPDTFFVTKVLLLKESKTINSWASSLPQATTENAKLS